MKIILTTSDIETLINKAYSGIEDIQFNTDDLEVTLKVNAEKFTQILKPHSATIVKENQLLTSKPNDKLTDDEKQVKEAKAGAMASGSLRRNIVPIG